MDWTRERGDYAGEFVERGHVERIYRLDLQVGTAVLVDQAFPAEVPNVSSCRRVGAVRDGDELVLNGEQVLAQGQWITRSAGRRVRIIEPQP